MGNSSTKTDLRISSGIAGIVNTFVKYGHGHQYFRTSHKEFYTDGTKKSETVVEINSNNETKNPQNLHGVGEDKQLMKRLKVPAIDSNSHERTKTDIHIRETKEADRGSTNSKAYNDNRILNDIEVDRVRNESGSHTAGILVIADQQFALSRYAQKPADVHSSTKTTSNLLQTIQEPEHDFYNGTPCPSTKISEPYCERRNDIETTVTGEASITEQLAHLDEMSSDSVICDDYFEKTCIPVTNDEYTNVSSIDVSLSEKKQYAQEADKSDPTKRFDGPIIEVLSDQAINGTNSTDQSETNLTSLLDVAQENENIYESPNVARKVKKEQCHSRVSSSTSTYPSEVGTILCNTTLFPLVYDETDQKAIEEDDLCTITEIDDSLTKQEVLSDDGYSSILSIISELMTKQYQQRSKGDETRLLENELKQALQGLDYKFATYIANRDLILAFPGLNPYFASLQSGRLVPEQDQMTYEWLRLMTFNAYNGNGYPVLLARSGFYHSGHNETRCFSCNRLYLNWNATDDVNQVHRRISPDCPFMVGGVSAAGNTPVDECVEESHVEGEGNRSLEMGEISLRSSERHEQIPRNGTVTNRFTTDPSLEQEAHNDLVTESADQAIDAARFGRNIEQTRHNDSDRTNAMLLANTDLHRQSQRNRNTRYDSSLVSNSGPWTGNASAGNLRHAIDVKTTPRELTCDSTEIGRNTLTAGFMVQGSQSISCTAERLASNENDELIGATGFDSSLVPETTFEVASDMFLTDSFASSSPEHTVRSETSETSPSNRCLTEYADDQLGPSKHPDYTTVRARLHSFATSPTNMKIDQLAVSGFFYTGENDCTRCFSCGGGLRNWNLDDDPFVEHARRYPHCKYINNLKGNAFVQQVIKSTCRREPSCQAQCTCNAGCRQKPVPIPPCYLARQRSMESSEENTLFVSDNRNTRQDSERLCSVDNFHTGRPGTAKSRVKSTAGAEARGANDKPALNREGNCLSSEETIYTSIETSSWEKTKQSKQVAVKQPKSKRKQSTGHRNGRAIIPSRCNIDVDTRQDRERFCTEDNFHTGRPGTTKSNVKSTAEAEAHDATDKPTINRKGNRSSSEDTVYTSIENSSWEKTKHKKQVAGKQGKSKREQSTGHRNGRAIVPSRCTIDVGTNTEQQSGVPLCKICVEQNVATTFRPCGHLVCCVECADMIQKCPECSAIITDRIRTFM